MYIRKEQEGFVFLLFSCKFFFFTNTVYQTELRKKSQLFAGLLTLSNGVALRYHHDPFRAECSDLQNNFL